MTTLETATVSSQRRREAMPATLASERLPRLHRGDRAHFIWIAHQTVSQQVEVQSLDADGKEFTFTLPDAKVEEVMRIVPGKIVKALPSLKEKRRSRNEPDTLHFKPDLDLIETCDGELQIHQPSTMVVRRQDLDNYIVINHRQSDPVPSINL